MDEFDPFSPSSHRSQPRSDSSMVNKNLEHVSEVGARYRRLDDQFNTYCVAVESSIMVVEDNDRRGSPSFTIETRGNLVAAAHTVKVTLRQYRTFLNSLHVDIRRNIPQAMFTLGGFHFDVLIPGMEREFRDLRSRLDQLISVQTDNVTRSNQISLPDTLQRGLERLCGNVDSVSSSGDGSRSGACSGPAWALYSKQQYPKFDGTFDHWHEWSSVMKKNVLPLFRNAPVLAASMLRDAVGVSTTCKTLIQSVDPSSHENPAGEMMSLLEAHFTSKSSLGLHYAKQLKQLKPVSEGSYKAFNEFILSLENIVGKILKHRVENYVEPTEIFRLQDCLPPSYRRGWTDLYGNLTADETACPLRPFMAYCLTLLPAVKKMALDRGVSETANAQAKSRYVTSDCDQTGAYNTQNEGSVSSDSNMSSFFCSFHDSDTHSTSQCKRFLDLTAKDRSKFCTQFKVCKVCLDSGHSSRDCTSNLVCKHCQKKNHHTLLCFAKDINENDQPRKPREMLGARNDSRKSPHPKQQSAINPSNSKVYANETDGSSQAPVNSNDSGNLPNNVSFQQPFPFYPPYYMFPQPMVNPFYLNASPPISGTEIGSQNFSSSGTSVPGGPVGQGPTIGYNPFGSMTPTSMSESLAAPQANVRSNPSASTNHVYSQYMRSNPPAAAQANMGLSSPPASMGYYPQPMRSNPPAQPANEGPSPSPGIFRISTQPKLGNTPAESKFVSSPPNSDRYGRSEAGSNVATAVVRSNPPNGQSVYNTQSGLSPESASGRTLASDSPIVTDPPAPPVEHSSQVIVDDAQGEVVSYSSQVHLMGLYSIYSIPFVKPEDTNKGGSHSNVESNDSMALVRSRSTHPSCFSMDTHIVGFLDSGSDSSFITRKCARRVNARLLEARDLTLTTLDGTGTQRTEIVSFYITDIHGKMHEITAYTRDFIGRPACQIDLGTLEAIFPGYDCSAIQRPPGELDLLLGADYFGLFPKTEILCSGNLSIMAGSLGPTLQGHHPALTAYFIQSPTGHCIRSITHTASVSMMSVKDFSLLPAEDISQKGSDKSARSSCVMYDDCTDSDPLMPELTYDNHSDFVENMYAGQCAPSSMGSVLSELTPDVPPLVDPSVGSASSDRPPDVVSTKSSSISPAESLPPTLRTLGCEAFVISCYERDDICTTSSSVVDSFAVPCRQTEFLYTTQDPHCTAIAKASRLPENEDFLSFLRIASFIEGEDFGTRVTPECGGCKCGNCPIPGHSYSFREEQELRLIKDGLRYIPERRLWVTSYPWIVDPSKLPNNYTQALAVLRSTERVLSCDEKWKETYAAQIYEHQARGVCRKLSSEEIDSWTGPVFYIAHMALEQPKSESTPVRVVFNASQSYKGVSLNSCLAKGPDRYNTSLLGMLIRWREFLICIIGDISKMYNSVHLEPLEQHVHRFLWRDCEDRPPDTYVMTRVSLGDRPSGTIAIVAKNETAKMFSHIDSDAAETLTSQAYVDDVLDSLMSWLQALARVGFCNEIAGMGSFVFKGWSFGGEGVPLEFLKDVIQRVLGLMYTAMKDSISFPPKLNFSPKKRRVPTGPDLTIDDIPHGIPTDTLTRRVCLSQVMGIYDPLGILSPLTLLAKQLLRESWQASKLWDDLLPSPLQVTWTDFFCSLFEVGDFHYRRSLTPSNAVGPPVLIICSDGSKEAYGACAYVRYLTTTGSYHSTLVMAKSKIGPKITRSIPQMELNGAVFASRIKYKIMTESRLKFSEIYNLTDSEIVLHQINSMASTFDVYTGVRIGEIQADNVKFPSTWAWIPGVVNPADMTTRPQPPENISPSSEWFNGPNFFSLPVSEWPMKIDPKYEGPPIDVRPPPPQGCYYSIHGLKVAPNALFTQLCSRISSYDKLINVVARVRQALKLKSFRGISQLDVDTRRSAEDWCIRQAQSCWSSLKDVSKQFRSVSCIEQDGIFVVSARNHLSGPLPIILPTKLRFTALALLKAHRDTLHAGRAKTSARFRMKFHTSHLNKLVASTCKSCMLCRRVKKVLLKQHMCKLPPERLQPAPPFNSVVLDLFGPISVRGEVNPRTTLKVWGVIFVCLTSRAVHIELASGYDTANFMLAFTRFASIRGYPEKVFADPGTQIQGAASEFQSMNASLDLSKLGSLCSKKGTSWFAGPADSPWYQGAAEALIKSTKLSLKFSTGSSRLSPFELLTALYEIANILNERPLGYFTPVSDDLHVITPNSLLLGRTLCANPGDFQQTSSLHGRVVMVKETVDKFWKHWSDNYAPTLIHQSKWLHESRDLALNDVVLIADRNVMKSEYKLGIVTDVKPSRDGRVRRAEVTYKRYRVGESIYECRGAKDVKVTRSAQRLALLIPVEERSDIVQVAPSPAGGS